MRRQALERFRIDIAVRPVDNGPEETVRQHGSDHRDAQSRDHQYVPPVQSVASYVPSIQPCHTRQPRLGIVWIYAPDQPT
jgi:hypothetical protein